MTITLSILESFRLENKIALVTGAFSGIGLSIAAALAQAGTTVACHGNSHPAEATAPAIRAADRFAKAFATDFSVPTGAEELFENVLKAYGKVNILANNAGIIIRHDAVESSFEDWQKVIQVNLNSVFQLPQRAGRSLIAYGPPGKIVNIASLLSFQGHLSSRLCDVKGRSGTAYKGACKRVGSQRNLG